MANEENNCMMMTYHHYCDAGEDDSWSNSLFSPCLLLLLLEKSRPWRRFLVAAATALVFLTHKLVVYVMTTWKKSKKRRQRYRNGRSGIQQELERQQQQQQQEQYLECFHEASHGILLDCDNDHSQQQLLLVSWINRLCQDRRDRIQFLGKLVWYRLLVVGTNPKSERNTTTTINADSTAAASMMMPYECTSWQQVLHWASGGNGPFAAGGGGGGIDSLLTSIVSVLGAACHVKINNNQLAVWPTCVLDALFRSVLLMTTQQQNHSFNQKTQPQQQLSSISTETTVESSSTSSSCKREEIIQRLTQHWRGQLLLMGILQQVVRGNDDANNSSTCYQVINNLACWEETWKDDVLLSSSSWKDTFVNSLQRMALISTNDDDDDDDDDGSSNKENLQPTTATTTLERTALYHLLPALYSHLGYHAMAAQVLREPIVIYFRLFRFAPFPPAPLFVKKHSHSHLATVLETDPPMHQTTAQKEKVSATTAVEENEVLALMCAQVAWKQRCCVKIAQKENERLGEAEILKHIGLELLHFPRRQQCGYNLIDEARYLRTKQLSQALQKLMNAMHYAAVVLWAKKGDIIKNEHEGRKFSPERLLSRRLFALQKEIQSRACTQSLDLCGWVDKVSKVLTETAQLDKDVDVKQGSVRLANALQHMNLVHRALLETCSLYDIEPDLVRENEVVL